MCEEAGRVRSRALRLKNAGPFRNWPDCSAVSSLTSFSGVECWLKARRVPAGRGCAVDPSRATAGTGKLLTPASGRGTRPLPVEDKQLSLVRAGKSRRRFVVDELKRGMRLKRFGRRRCEESNKLNPAPGVNDECLGSIVLVEGLPVEGWSRVRDAAGEFRMIPGLLVFKELYPEREVIRRDQKRKYPENRPPPRQFSH